MKRIQAHRREGACLACFNSCVEAILIGAALGLPLTGLPLVEGLSLTAISNDAEVFNIGKIDGRGP